MFSSVECSIRWAATILEVPVGTYAPEESEKLTAFAITERTGGSLDYPHDNPDITFQIWAKEEARAEQLANLLAIAAKTMPIDDSHVNTMDVPEMMSYGKAEGDWFIWQVSVGLNVNLLD